MSYHVIIDPQKRFLSRILLATAIVITSVASVGAQSPGQVPPYGPAHMGPDPITEDFNRGRIRPEPRWGPPREKRVLTKGLLGPSKADRTENEAFLKQPDTGLIKLLPREILDWRISKTAKRLSITGGGAYFSFFYQSHESAYGSDLELDHNMFSVGFADLDHGMMVNVGDVPLSDLSPTDSRAAFIAAYRPAGNEPDARCEIKRFRNGVTIDGSLYKHSLPVEVNSTYLLRSINRRSRSDLLVGFRVTRQETDGSVIIAWKLLKQFQRPGFFRVLYVDQIDKCPIK